jgi:hypothetical protein
MNQYVKDMWLKALRGEEFKQGRGKLSYISWDGGKVHCVLGVLAELHRQQTGQEGDLTGNYPGREVVVWAGLKDFMPTVEGCSLAELNDAGYTFKQLADLIDFNLSGNDSGARTGCDPILPLK